MRSTHRKVLYVLRPLMIAGWVAGEWFFVRMLFFESGVWAG